MKLYCRGGVVVAIHADTQNVRPEAYGDDVSVLIVADDAHLSALPDDPARPEGVPALDPFVFPAGG